MSSKACSGIEYFIVSSPSIGAESEKCVKETIEKANTLHSSLLLCSLRKKEEEAKSKSKTTAASSELNPTNTLPYFVFILASNEQELLELVMKNIEEQKKQEEESKPKKPFFYYYALSVVASGENSEQTFSAETISKLNEIFPNKHSEGTSANNNNKTLIFSSSTATRLTRKFSGNTEGETTFLLLEQVKKQSKTQRWTQIAWRFPSSSALQQKQLNEMWTACLDAAQLSTIVAFWYGSQAGNAEYITTQLHHMFSCNERVGKEKYLPASKEIQNFLTQSNGVVNQQSQLVLLDTLNSFVKKEMLGTAIITRYTCVHIFVCSTHGDGDFPDNASRVKKYINTCQTAVAALKDAPVDLNDSFEKKEQHFYAKLFPKTFFFSLLALGDTNYSKFAEAGNLLNRKLKEIGCNCIKPIECADDGIGLELVVDPYLEHVWTPFEKTLHTALSEMKKQAEDHSSFHCALKNSPLAAVLSASSVNNENSFLVGTPLNPESSSSLVEQGNNKDKDKSNNSKILATASSSSLTATKAGKFYEVSTVVLFAPSALTHAGALQSILVNAGLHGVNSLPVLIPLRAFAPLRSEYQNNDESSPSSSDDGLMSPATSSPSCHSSYSLRLPCATHLFVITSSDAPWWDTTSSNNNSSSLTTTIIDEKSKRSAFEKELAFVSSRVETFAYFDIEESLCIQQHTYQQTASRALCLPEKTDIFSAFAGAINHNNTNSNNIKEDPEARCAFTNWLRSLARWLIPRTINFDQLSSAQSPSLAKISEAVNNIVDSVIHGHHERGMLAPPVSFVNKHHPHPQNHQHHHHQHANTNQQQQNTSTTADATQNKNKTSSSSGEALHFLSLKRTIVFFSKSSVEEQQSKTSSNSYSDASSFLVEQDNYFPSQKNQLQQQGQSLAEDVARGIVATSLHGLDVDVADVSHFKTAGFPRKGVFVFVVGPDSSKGTQRLIAYINSIIAATTSALLKKHQQESATTTTDVATATATTTSSNNNNANPHPFRGLSFTILGIEWLHRSSQDYGGALELELLLQEAGATKIHPTGLARTGTIDSVVSRWRKNLKRAIEVCGPVNGYIEYSITQQQQQQQNVGENNNNKNSPSLVAKSGPTLDHQQTMQQQQMSSFVLDGGGRAISSSMDHNHHHHQRGTSPKNRSTPKKNQKGIKNDHDDDDEQDDNDDHSTDCSTCSSSERNGSDDDSSDQSEDVQQNSATSNNILSASSWEPWISVRPTPASLAAKTAVSIVVALSLTGFSKWIARKCANEAKILGYNVVFVGNVTNAEDFLSLPSTFVVIVCGLRSPKRLLRGLIRLQASRSDVLSHLSFGCIGVISTAQQQQQQEQQIGSNLNNSTLRKTNNNNSSTTPPLVPSSAPYKHLNNNSVSGSQNGNTLPTLLPGVELASHLELCGSQRVFPNAAVDSPTGAETKGLLWLRGVLTAFSRMTARRQFLQTQNLPSLPPLAADADKPAKYARSITFIFTSDMTQMIARDIVEEATVRNFIARILPARAFREIIDPLDGTCSAIVVILCDETSSANCQSVSQFSAALAKSSVLRNATNSKVCVFGIGDRATSLKKQRGDGLTTTNTSENRFSLVCPLSAQLSLIVDKYMKPFFAVRACDTNDPNVVLAIQGFRDDVFASAVSSFENATKPASADGQQQEETKTAAIITFNDDNNTNVVIQQQQHDDKNKNNNNNHHHHHQPDNTASDEEAELRKNHLDENDELENEWFVARIAQSQTLTSEVTKPSVIYMSFEVYYPDSDSDEKQQSEENEGKRPKSVIWTPGDAVQILPENNPQEVEEILKMLNINNNGDEPFVPPTHPSVKKEDSRFPNAPIYSKLDLASNRISCRDMLQKHLSLKIHNREVCLMMERYVTDVHHRAILRQVADQVSSTGSGSSAPPLIELLQQIRESVKLVPLRGFVESLPMLQPRCYSITTAHSADPNHIGIAFKVVKNGVCTNWLQRLAAQFTENGGSSNPIEIPMRMRFAPEFRMPHKLSTPMILIGPGTGVAPFMSFLSHREADLQNMIVNEHKKRLASFTSSAADEKSRQKEQQALIRTIANEILSTRAGAINLYFGCRSKYHDYLFEGDLAEWKQAGVLTSLNVAFSQDSNGGVWFGGLYVQDLLREAGLELCRMILEQQAHVYVCGDASSMAKDVHQVLLDIFQEFRGMSLIQAQNQLKTMEENGAYQRDIWG